MIDNFSRNGDFHFRWIQKLKWWCDFYLGLYQTNVAKICFVGQGISVAPQDFIYNDILSHNLPLEKKCISRDFDVPLCNLGNILITCSALLYCDCFGEYCNTSCSSGEKFLNIWHSPETNIFGKNTENCYVWLQWKLFIVNSLIYRPEILTWHLPPHW